NNLLAAVSYVPASNFNGSFDIATSVMDDIDTLTGTKTMSGTAVNDAPVLDATKSPILATVDEDAGLPVGAVGTPISNLVDPATPAGGLDNV
ncbi:hypothetical protein, partial [Salmonella sp. SAL4458]|uniref:hypothetical protein n=1 Tax=Salmonella sp. SAL4458 TaxID=3159913 RepID=UPI00397CF257